MKQERRDLGEPKHESLTFLLSLLPWEKPIVEPSKATQLHSTPLCPLGPHPPCPVAEGRGNGRGLPGSLPCSLLCNTPSHFLSQCEESWACILPHSDSGTFPGDFSIITAASYIILSLLLVTISFRVYRSVIQTVQKSKEDHAISFWKFSTIVTVTPSTGSQTHHMSVSDGKVGCLHVADPRCCSSNGIAFLIVAEL